MKVVDGSDSDVSLNRGSKKTSLVANGQKFFLSPPLENKDMKVMFKTTLQVTQAAFTDDGSKTKQSELRGQCPAVELGCDHRARFHDARPGRYPEVRADEGAEPAVRSAMAVRDYLISVRTIDGTKLTTNGWANSKRPRRTRPRPVPTMPPAGRRTTAPR